MTQKNCEICGQKSSKVVCDSHMGIADSVIEALHKQLFRMDREHKRLEWDFECLRVYVQCLHEDEDISEEAVDRAADRADGMIPPYPTDALEDGPPLCATCGGEGSIQHLQYEEDCPDCGICEKCNGERYIETPQGDVDCTHCK